jgi:hypothetical protein
VGVLVVLAETGYLRFGFGWASPGEPDEPAATEVAQGPEQRRE